MFLGMLDYNAAGTQRAVMIDHIYPFNNSGIPSNFGIST